MEVFGIRSQVFILCSLPLPHSHQGEVTLTPWSACPALLCGQILPVFFLRPHMVRCLRINGLRVNEIQYLYNLKGLADCSISPVCPHPSCAGVTISSLVWKPLFSPYNHLIITITGIIISTKASTYKTHNYVLLLLQSPFRYLSTLLCQRHDCCPWFTDEEVALFRGSSGKARKPGSLSLKKSC
jgi:hypothetical protein